MTARAADAVCRRKGFDPEAVDQVHGLGVGTPPCGKKGSCPCIEHLEAAAKPGHLGRLINLITFQKDTSAACIGCLEEGEQVGENGIIVRTCARCPNHKARVRMETAIEALGGARA